MYPPWIREVFTNMQCSRCHQPIGLDALEVIGLQQSGQRTAFHHWPMAQLRFRCGRCGQEHQLTQHVSVDDLIVAIHAHYHRHSATGKTELNVGDVPFDTPTSSPPIDSSVFFGRSSKPLPPITEAEVKRFIAKLKPLEFRRHTKRYRALMRAWGIEPDAPSN